MPKTNAEAQVEVVDELKQRSLPAANSPAKMKEQQRRNSGGQQLNSLSSSNSSSSGDEMRIMSTNAEYDHIRNTTLMFFLDRLFIASKDGKEARTLHDLSCLFGTRDFTKEMRQIVGASRNGLKKFLQSYPSLFTIEGDKVYLTQLEQETNSSRTRDYNKEAVDYFTQKLVQFGASLVPIRNLFGYRSQASQEVRHVSGKNTKEFKQFLSAHEDVFEILNDEHVVLKTALKELELKGELSTSRFQQQLSQMPSTEEAVMDPYLNKQFAHWIEQCMREMFDQSDETAREEKNSDDSSNKMKKESEVEVEEENNKPTTTTTSTTTDHHKITIQNLHCKILKDCQNQLFLKMVKTIEDLKVFLRMHPRIFKRLKCDDEEGTDYVCLLSEEERRELELQAYPSQQLTRQQSTLRRSETNESNLSSLTCNDSNNHTQQQFTSLPPQAQMTPSTTSISTKSPRDYQQSPSATEEEMTRSLSTIDNQSNGPSSLRATAPPFVPSSFHPNPPTKHQQQVNYNKPIQRSVSNLNQGSAAQHQQQRAFIDQRQAVRSYLIKASAENAASGGIYSPLKNSNGAQQLQQQQQKLNNNINQPLTRQSSIGDVEDLRARTVNIVREASNVIARIMTTTDAVALDCKGYNLGFNGQITMIQFGFLPNNNNTSKSHSHHRAHLSTFDSTKINNINESESNGKQTAGGSVRQKPEVCVFDLITNPELAYCLKPLLESEQIVKIVHDVRNKSNLLYSQFGIMLNHVFDTQVANLVIQQQETGKPAYKSRYISMSRLCEIYGDDHLMKYRNYIRLKHSGGSTSNNQQLINSNGTHSGKMATKDVNYWKTRPLTQTMVLEATVDVYCLVGGVYQNLKSKIKPEYKPLFEQLNLEGVLARIKPEEIRSVKKERKIDLEVIDLKRKLYSDATSSIVLSNREIRLLRHIDLSDEVRNKIQQCKKVAKKLERLDMKAAQNAQLLQSMNSQTSTNDGEQSLDPSASLQTNGGSSLTSSNRNDSNNNINNGSDSTTSGDADRLKPDEVVDDDHGMGVAGIGNLMDGSMFDELKDKMIESSSLLESLDDDDDEYDEMRVKRCTTEEELVEQFAQTGSIGNHSHHSGNHENCRCNCHKEMSSLKSSSSSTSNASAESKVVDMAIQCDLLS